MTEPAYWAIARTEIGREVSVARALVIQGLQAWWPSEFRWRKSAAGRNGQARQWSVSLIPRAVLCPAVEAIGYLRPIRGLAGWERDAYGTLVLVPHPQVIAFQQAVMTENERRMAQCNRRRPEPKRRAVWQKLEPGSLAEVLSRLYGRSDGSVSVSNPAILTTYRTCPWLPICLAESK